MLIGQSHCLAQQLVALGGNSLEWFHFQAGDQIVRVDGLILSDSTHEEFLNLLRTKKSFTLSIKGKNISTGVNHGH